MKCKICSVEITPWMLFRWMKGPSRLICPQCKTLYKVKTPYMTPILIGYSLLTIILLIGLGILLILGEEADLAIIYFPLYLIFMGIILCGLELVMHKYILKKGSFQETEETINIYIGPNITPGVFYAVALCLLVFGLFMLGISAKLLSFIDIFGFMILIYILCLIIVLMGMIFGVKREVEKLKDKMKE